MAAVETGFQKLGQPVPDSNLVPDSKSGSWQTTTAANGAHTLSAVARDTGGNTTTSAGISVTVSNAGFASGDVFVAIVDGVVQWRSPDGTLRGTLTSPHDGQVSSAAFDSAGRLYVPHWWGRAQGAPGNMVVRFDGTGSLSSSHS